ncbi:MAG TPA: NAD(P)/FAD-dependent oxidoreductase, partial [Sorangium sp.]|nr:NAD(P)/FAD-dependent oxidoreductase [Sorangium sp.]
MTAPRRIEPMAVPVAIVGAGLTGMSAAHHLHAAGMECAIFEKEAQVGGHAITTEERGYRFDRTGHLLHLKDPGVKALALAWIGPEYLEVARNSAVFSH